MNSRLIPLLAALGSFVAPSVVLSAESKPSAPATEAAAETSAIAGEYVGKWQGSDDASGKLRMTLKRDGQTWSADVSFTFEGSDIATKVKGVKVDGKKVEVIVEWEIREDTGQSTLTGDATDTQLTGTYQTKTSTGTGQGTWTVTRV